MPNMPGVTSASIESGRHVRQRMLAGHILAGGWLSLGSSIAAEIAAGAGFDWLLFDLEHGTSEFSDLLHQLQAIQAYPVAGIVRVPAIEASVFKRVLDLGAHGLMIPQVSSVEDARRCVSFARIPPLGIRGAAQTTRASGYGVHYEQYLREANDSIILTAQIESRAGVAAVEAIAAVDGIDALFVGPTDLGVDLGVASDELSGEFLDAVVSVATAARRHGKAAGVLVRNAEQAQQYFDLGYSFIALGSDRGSIGAGMRASAAALNDLRLTPNLKAMP
jgi:2-keto-3-deoxy-L-rhamnonate aldolase RhmA